MVLVDSSVWIQYFGPHASEVDKKLEGLLRPANQVVITGIIFQEVLQGIKHLRSYQLTKKLMGRLPFLLPTAETHGKASEIFRMLTEKGRKPTTIDAFLAALAIENRIPLFTLDRGFHFIEA